MDKEITKIATTDWRNQHNVFGIKDEDRMYHIYCIGKTGVGKSTLLLNMAISDIARGKGIAVIDPHGDLAEKILDYVPELRVKDVIYFNPVDGDYCIAFNPLSKQGNEDTHLIVSGIITTFKKIWIDSWGPRLEYILRHCLLALLHYPKATLLHVQPLLTDRAFRDDVLLQVKDDFIRQFWYLEFDKYPPALKAEVIAPVLNKVGVFSASIPLRNIIGHSESGFDVSEIMNEGKIFVANLSKGIVGEDASSILGSLLVNSFQLAALGRAKLAEEKRRPFYLYIDEAHNFISDAVADILSEARKFKLSLFLSHQYIQQLSLAVRTAVFGNIGTLISFRVGADDASYLAREFYPAFTEDDLINLPKYSIYLKLMIDGLSSKPFSAHTLPLPKHSYGNKEKNIALARKYGTRKQVAFETGLCAVENNEGYSNNTLFG